MSTSSAVAREAAWLATTGDSLPSLPSQAGGPWQVVQGYWPRTPRTNVSGIYVLRTVLDDNRAANQRIRPHYGILLRCVWPVITTGTPMLETAQQDLDDAVDLLIQRIRGPVGDKSHGGRFLSAGENPRRVAGKFDDPERMMAQYKALRAEIVYGIDDFDVNS